MILQKRYLAVCKVVTNGINEPSKQAMETSVSLALPDLRPSTIADALDDYLEQHWSSKPHEVTFVRSVSYGGELYAAVEYPVETDPNG